jgi:alpha-1,3-rhamnosyl/mannosyltransferase
MSCGTPVTCSNTSSLPEVAGDAAVLFDPRDPESIAAGLGALIADETRLSSMKEKSILQASRFSWEQIAVRTIETYQRVCPSDTI